MSKFISIFIAIFVFFLSTTAAAQDFRIGSAEQPLAEWTQGCPDHPNQDEPGECGCGCPPDVCDTTDICVISRCIPNSSTCQCEVTPIEGCCTSDAQCPGDPSNCLKGVCDLSINRCRSELDLDNCCINDSHCFIDDPQGCQSGRCNPDNNRCEILEDDGDGDGDGVRNCEDECPEDPTAWKAPCPLPCTLGWPPITECGRHEQTQIVVVPAENGGRCDTPTTRIVRGDPCPECTNNSDCAIDPPNPCLTGICVNEKCTTVEDTANRDGDVAPDCRDECPDDSRSITAPCPVDCVLGDLPKVTECGVHTVVQEVISPARHGGDCPELQRETILNEPCPECEAFSLDVILGGLGGQGDGFSLTEEGEGFPCLIDQIKTITEQCVTEVAGKLEADRQENQAAYDRWIALVAASGTTPEAVYLDDCVANHFVDIFEDAQDWYGSTYDAQCNRTESYAWGETCVDGVIYLDQHCEQLADRPADVCDAGFYSWLVSPISLVWEDGADINEEITFTQFPVNPGTEALWYTWKASSKAPLLVHDPEGKGLVTSPSQLFGNWTFGGKQSALQRISLGAATKAQSWRDGYEALATLDANLDGEVSGAELKDLALWFDENRDGISQAGEVKTLDEAGVTRLFYSSDRTDASGDIHAARGFERKEGDKLYVGASVDWFSRAEKDQATLINKLLSRSEGVSEASDNKSEKVSETATLNSVNVSGIWKWHVQTTQGKVPAGMGGILTIKDNHDGTIRGHSYAETPLPKASGAAGQIIMRAFTGTKTLNNDRTEISFDISAAGSLLSTVAMVKDKSSLSGKTSVKLRLNGQDTKFSYSWVAKRQK